MPPKQIPPTIETYDALVAGDHGISLLSAEPSTDDPGLSGYLIPWYTLSDRGTYFVPGSAKRTAKAKVSLAPHLYQHDTYAVLGVHTGAVEDDTGFRIDVAFNMDKPLAQEVHSDLKFGKAKGGFQYGLSVGFDPVADRSGTEADDKLLNRKTAPALFKHVPINELRAITEFRWWESSTVTFAGIATAKPDVIHASGELLATLLQALRDGTASTEQLASARAIVAAMQSSPAPGQDHGTDELEPRRNHKQEIAARLSAYAERFAQELSA